MDPASWSNGNQIGPNTIHIDARFMPDPLIFRRGMGLLEAVRRHVDREDAIYECRHCGRSVARNDETCPTCGSTEIAHYRC